MASVAQAGPCHADHPFGRGNDSHSGDRGSRPYRRLGSAFRREPTTERDDANHATGRGWP